MGKIYLAFKNDQKIGGEIFLSEDLRQKAEKPLRKMLEMS